MPSVPRPKLRLELFGGPVLWRGKSTVRVPPLQDCLLSIVFTFGTNRVPRALIQSLLWEPGSEKDIRHRLSQLVYQLKGSCGAAILEFNREHLCVNRQEISCDLDDFDRMIDSRQFEHAYEMIDRGFLSALTKRRTEAFSDWVGDKREERCNRLRTAARAYLDSAESARDGVRAREAGEVLLQLNPAREADLRRAMRTSADSGHVREAETAYGSFAERASRSGDWEPAPDTATLLQRVQAEATTEFSDGSGSEDRRKNTRCVGRDADGYLLAKAVMRQESAGGWRTVAVVGDEGIGKTRLAERALRWARLRGYLVATASATELESRIHLNLLLEALSGERIEPLLHDIPAPWKETVQSLLPRLREEGAHMPTMHHPATDILPRRTCEALHEIFKCVAKSQRTVLFLDNFQWTDEATLTALDFLVRRWGHEQFTLVVAYRPAEVQEILSFDPQATIIELDGLDSESARTVVERVGAKDLSDSAIERIVDLAGGNPRFLVDLAATWPTDAPQFMYREQLSAPLSAHRALDRRMRSLSHHSKAVASCLCVLGTTVTLPEVIRLTDITREECVDAVEELYASGLLDWTDPGIGLRYRIFGVALYEKLSPARRSLLHTRVAELLHNSDGHGCSDRIALHYYRAGKHDIAYEYATTAVKRAAGSDVRTRLLFLTLAYDASNGVRRRTAALKLARLNKQCRRLDAALRRAEELLRDPGGLIEIETGELRLIAAEARHRLGIAGTAPTLAEFAAIEREASGPKGECLRAAVLDATVQLLDRVGDNAAVLELQARIGELAPMSHPAAQSRVCAALSTVASRSEPEAAVRLGRQAVEAAREASQPDALAVALQRLLVALASVGRLGTEEGWNALNEVRKAHAEAGNTGAFALALLHLTDWQTKTGDHETAEATLAEAATTVVHMDCPEIRTLEALVRGNLAIAQGDIDAARVSLRKGLEIVAGAPGGDSSPPSIPRRMVSALNALEGNLLLESGKFALASEVEQRTPLPDSLENAPSDLIVFHSRLASRRGDARYALALLERAVAANGGTRPMAWLRLALEVVRLARRSGAPRPELAAKAHATATGLGLTGLAHEFLPFRAGTNRP